MPRWSRMASEREATPNPEDLQWLYRLAHRLATHVSEPADESMAGTQVAAGSPSRAPWRERFDDLMHAPKASVAGTVRDAEGHPLVGATVCARVDSDRLAEDPRRELPCVTSTAGGAYEVAELIPVTYRLSASAPHHRPADWSTPQADVIALKAGEQRTGGATLTDDEGQFVLWAAPGRVAVSATAFGYGPQTDYATAPGSTLELQLIPEAVLRGTVVSASSGEPLPGVRVSLSDQPWSAFTRRHSDGVFTDERGVFRITGLSPGSYMPEVHTDELYGRVAFPVDLGFAAESPEITIVAHPAVSVDGRVATADGARAGCSKGYVVLEDRTSHRGVAAPIEDDRAVHLAGLLPGTYKVTIGCDGLHARPHYEDVIVGDQSLAGLTWVVDHGIHVTGQVLDAAGQGVPMATVVASPALPETSVPADGASVTANLEGRFELGGLAPITYNLIAKAPGYLDSQSTPLSLAHKAQPAPLLAPGDGGEAARAVGVHLGTTSNTALVVEAQDGEISGRVVDRDGPVADAFVDAAWQPGAGRPGSFFASSKSAVLTDDDGRFHLAGLRRGQHTVRAVRRGGGGESYLPNVSVGADVELHLCDNGSIRGVVERDDGTAPEAFEVELRDPQQFGRRQHQRLFRTDGRFRFDHVPPGRWNLEVTSPDGTAQTDIMIDEGQSRDDLALRLTTRGSIRGTLVDLWGTPVPGYAVTVGIARGTVMEYDAIASGERRVSDADGHFEIHNTPGGRVVLSIRAQVADGQVAGAHVYRTVPAGMATELPPIVLAPKSADEASDLGFTLVAATSDQEEETIGHVVATVRPAGPADQAGLRVGARIRSVNGRDVTGPNHHLYRPLTAVKPSTALELGLADGTTLTVTAAAP